MGGAKQSGSSNNVKESLTPAETLPSASKARSSTKTLLLAWSKLFTALESLYEMKRTKRHSPELSGRKILGEDSSGSETRAPETIGKTKMTRIIWNN